MMHYTLSEALAGWRNAGKKYFGGSEIQLIMTGVIITPVKTMLEEKKKITLNRFLEFLQISKNAASVLESL